MNAYDFDKTIYRHDCTVMFYLWCCMHYPKIIRRWPALIRDSALKMAGKLTKHVYMERFYQYLHDVPDVSAEVGRFWDRHEKAMHDWYRKTQQPDDLIISASPLFLVSPIANRLGVKHVLASPLNPRTGLYEGERCHGKGKVTAFRLAFPDGQIDSFYSDSLSDTPMAEISREAWLVHKETLTPWPALRKDDAR